MGPVPLVYLNYIHFSFFLTLVCSLTIAALPDLWGFCSHSAGHHWKSCGGKVSAWCWPLGSNSIIIAMQKYITDPSS